MAAKWKYRLFHPYAMYITVAYYEPGELWFSGGHWDSLPTIVQFNTTYGGYPNVGDLDFFEVAVAVWRIKYK